jgi:L-serine deaminase
MESQFTLEQQHVIELAFNATLRKLGLVDRNDPVCEMIARKVIEIADSGVTNAVAISEMALRQLGL